VLKDIHSNECFDNSIEIANKGNIEIVELNLTISGEALLATETHIDIEFQTERNEETR